MKKKIKAVKKKNVQDATLRNIRALKTRVKNLSDRVEYLCGALNDLRDEFRAKPK